MIQISLVKSVGEKTSKVLSVNDTFRVFMRFSANLSEEGF